MGVYFRVDASTQIGSGHVMRCLTLAKYLSSFKVKCIFLCREHEGNLNSFIKESGFEIIPLPRNDEAPQTTHENIYESWLGCDWYDDARDCLDFITKRNHKIDWLVVDHYGIDERWHKSLRDVISKILVIDDIGNRQLDCDLLLDQNFTNPIHKKYETLAPPTSDFLLGPKYALIRNEFAELREESLNRRTGVLHNILVSMGGTDKDNDTLKVLNGLAHTEHSSLKIDAVIGAGNPNRQSIELICNEHKNMTLHIQTPHMAKLMRDADCAFMAGGSTTWERCVMGLPTIVTIQADNQKNIAKTLSDMNAHILAGHSSELEATDYLSLFEKITSDQLLTLSKASAKICDGLGTARVAKKLCPQP